MTCDIKSETSKVLQDKVRGQFARKSKTHAQFFNLGKG